MALQTKSISANGAKGHHKFTLKVTENSTNTSNNTSSVSWSLILSPVSSGYDWSYSNTVPVSYTVTFNGTKYIEILKFVSPQVGILSFRYRSIEDLCGRTYLTVDGGLTWTKISQLSYPFGNVWKVGYTEVVDIEQIEDDYILTVKVQDVDNIEVAQFVSKDLISWSVIEN